MVFCMLSFVMLSSCTFKIRLLNMFLYVNRSWKFLPEFVYVPIHSKNLPNRVLIFYILFLSRNIQVYYLIRERGTTLGPPKVITNQNGFTADFRTPQRERSVVLVANARSETDDQSTSSEASGNPKVNVLRISRAKVQKNCKIETF